MSIGNAEQHIAKDVPATKEWLRLTVAALVDHEDDVQIEAETVSSGTRFKVAINPRDMGKLIGRQGGNVRAVRRLLVARSARDKASYAMEVREAERVC